MEADCAVQTRVRTSAPPRARSLANLRPRGQNVRAAESAAVNATQQEGASMTAATRWMIAGAAVLGLVASASAQEVATGVFKNADGKDVGTVRIEHISSATLFLIKVHDLSPGQHGLHIHSVGQCTAPTFDSAGPHWNPLGKKHGKESPDGPHLGDLPNLVVGADGKAEAQFNLEGITLRGEGNILDGDGASIVIHAGQDDYKTDPSGNSGARIACAVIGLDQRQE